MTINEIKNKIETDEYSFLRDNEHLGKNIILLGLGGSYAYGTNTPESDLDIRGIALNTKEEILTNVSFENFINNETDTVIYGFYKILSLLTSCNPNTIEMLGLKPEHYLYLSPIGKELLDNKSMFLSQKATYSFGGYATAQLRRLQNKAGMLDKESELEKHILNSIKHAYENFKDKYFYMPDDSIKLYIDKALDNNGELTNEIFMDVNLTHYPLRDYKCMWSEMHNIVKSYNSSGHRNNQAIEKGKLNKHIMHLVRLYHMCFDILEKGEINTYREKELDFLMQIRNGIFLDAQNQPTAEFYEYLDKLETRLNYASENTFLPPKPDFKRINEFMMHINEKIVKNEI